MPVDPRLAFEAAQAAVLEEHGVQASSRYRALGAPVLRTHILEAGSGSPVVLLHGGGGVAAYWAPLLARLQDRFKLYAPDRPGCGLSERRLRYDRFSLREHAAIFVESLLDELGLERATIVANSMGGYFSLAFATAKPERVDRLILLGAPAGFERRLPGMMWAIGRRPLGRLVYSTILRPGPATGKRMAAQLVGDADAVSPRMREVAIRAAQLRGATESWLDLVHEGSRAFNRESQLVSALRPELHRVECPTLMVWGSRDAFEPVESGRELERILPNARLEVVDGAGHLPWIDAADRVGGLVLDELERGLARKAS
ncbi:MAG: alpha/beta fold hydrolase [Actinobacteria bacterium]|nr:alpha/beta fold hydrolase [Actinomycetota bacterium]